MASNYLDDLEFDWVFWRDNPVVRSLGGLVDPGYLDNFKRMLCSRIAGALRSSLDVHQQRDWADQLERLTLVFVDNGDINMLATQAIDRRSIIVDIELLTRLWHLLAVSLADSEFLGNLLESQAPGSSTQDIVFDAYVTDSSWVVSAPHQWSHERVNFLSTMFDVAIDFLIYHELAHHARAHLELVHEDLGANSIDEQENLHYNVATEEHGLNLLRFIEFDADHHALDLFMIALEERKPMEQYDEEGSRTRAFVDSLCILCVFLLFDLEYISISESYEGTHPPAVHRAMRATNELVTTWAAMCDWTDQDRIDVHDEAWCAAARVAELLGMPEGRWHGESMSGMNADRLYTEETGFFEFSRRLDSLNAES